MCFTTVHQHDHHESTDTPMEVMLIVIFTVLLLSLFCATHTQTPVATIEKQTIQPTEMPAEVSVPTTTFVSDHPTLCYLCCSIGLFFGIFIALINYTHSWMLLNKMKHCDDGLMEIRVIIQLIIMPIYSILKGILYATCWMLLMPIFLYVAYDYHFYHKLLKVHDKKTTCKHPYNKHVYPLYFCNDYYYRSYNAFIVY